MAPGPHNGGESPDPNSYERACYEAYSSLAEGMASRRIGRATATADSIEVDVQALDSEILLRLSKSEPVIHRQGFRVSEYVDGITNTHWTEKLQVTFREDGAEVRFDHLDGEGYRTRPVAERALPALTGLANFAVHPPNVELDLFERAYGDLRDWLDEAGYVPEYEYVADLGGCDVYKVEFEDGHLTFYDVLNPLNPGDSNPPILRTEAVPTSDNKHEAFQCSWQLTKFRDRHLEAHAWSVIPDPDFIAPSPRQMAENLDLLVENYTVGGLVYDDHDLPDVPRS